MKKKIIIVVAVILALLAVFVMLKKNKDTNSPRTSGTTASSTISNGPTNQEKQAEAQAEADKKKALINNNTSNTTTPTEPATTPTLELSARSESNGTITVFSKLYKISSGTCNLTVSNGSKQKSLSADVIYQPEYSSCAGFSVPQADLGTGNWTVKLSVQSNGSTYDKTITYEVK